MAFSVSYIYSIRDQYSSKLRKISKATGKYTKQVRSAQAATKGFTDGINKMRGSLAVAAAAAGAMALFPINEAIKFEAAMADVSKVVDFKTPEQFKALEKDIMASAEAMGRLPTDIAKIVAAGGRLGIPLEKLGDFTALASRTSVAFDIMEETAGNSLASITDKLKLTIDQTGDLMDAVNFIADNSSAKAGGMIEIIGRLSGTMKTVGMPPELIAAWAGLADRVEVTPRLAASGMKMMMRGMKGMPGMMEKLLKAPSATMSEYLKRLAKIDKKRLPKVLEKIFGAEAAGFVEKLVGNIDLLDESLGLVGNRTKFVGSMQRELEKKLGTTDVKLKQVKTAFINMAIVAGTAVLPIIKQMTPILMKIGATVQRFAEAHPGLMKFAIIGGLIFAAFTMLLIPLGLMSGAITALIGLGGALAGVFALVFSPITLAVVAVGLLIAAFIQLRKHWDAIKSAVGVADKVKAFFGMGEVKAPTIAPISQSSTVQGSVAAQKTLAANNTLNGRIEVAASGGARVKKAEMRTSTAGNLGFNMAPAGGK